MAPFRESRFLVVGASGRMTAAMLKRLNLPCSVIDLFGDEDTRMICDDRVIKVDRLSDLHLHRNFIQDHEWILFAGGLESHPQLAKQLAGWSKPLFTSADSLQRLTDLDVINEAMATADLHQFPLSQNMAKDKFPSVAKILNGSGRAILIESENDALNQSKSGMVFQPFIKGTSVSLIFVSDGSTARFLGSSIQLVESMRWVGSISGLKLSDEETVITTQFANAISNASGLHGIFGIDFIRNESGIWPVDINPRVPASAEVVGLATLQAHLRSFGIETHEDHEQSNFVQGKLVLFNESNFPIQFSRHCLPSVPLRHESSFEQTSIADIPKDGETIEPGCPVLTIFAAGRHIKDVCDSLFAKRREFAASLKISSP